MSKTVVAILGFALLFILFMRVPVSMAESFIPVFEGRWAAEKPKIDGRLDDPCWQEGTPVNTFWLVDGSAKRTNVAWARVAYDDDNIYISYKIKADNTSGLGKGSKVRDVDVWGGPHVQIFLQPSNSSSYYTFTLNSANTRHDEKDFIESWNGRWDSAVFIAPDQSYWQVEIAIPYATLDLWSRPQTPWRMNLTCGVVLAGKTEYLTWSPAFGNFHCPDLFGKLILKNGKWENFQYLLTPVVNPDERGELQFCTHVKAAQSITCELVGLLRSPDGGMISQNHSLRLMEGMDTFFKFPFKVNREGRYEFTVTLKNPKTKQIVAERWLTVEGPPALEAWLDRSLYIHQKEATLTIKSNYPDSTVKACKVIMQNANGNKIVNIPMAGFNKNSLAKINLPIDNLTVGQYTVSVVLENHKPLICTLKKLAPLPGTISYDDRGVLYKDETPFFPIGLYYFREYAGKDKSLLTEFADAGFNTIIEEWVDSGMYVREMKDWEQKGINQIASVQNEINLSSMRNDGHTPENKINERVEAIVKSVADSCPTNLIAWYVYDEPGVSTLELVQKWAKLVARNDPRHPTLVTLWTAMLYEHFGKITDILAIDPYPGFPGGILSRVSTYTEEAHRAVRGRKPVIVVIQAFGEPIGNPKGLLPTPAEIRCQTYLALVKEARGILFFSYSYNGPMKTAHPEHWKEMKRLATEMRVLAPILVNTSGKLEVKQSQPQILTRLIQHDKIAYMLAVNSLRTKASNVQWQTRGFKDGVLEVVGENRNIELKNGKFSDHYEPLDVHVYRQINLK
ncbi:MAG: sugar-binding protein [Phycisphaerae bacterium]